jgi:hypothetical protein
MNFDGKPQGSPGLFTRLLRLPPLPRVIAGIVAILGGAVTTVLLWGKGVVWGLTLFAFVAGLFLLISGLVGLRHQKERQALLDSVSKRKEEMIREMIEAKRKGYNPIRWLNDQGILDAEIRTMLLDAVNERLRSEEPPGPGNKKPGPVRPS